MLIKDLGLPFWGVMYDLIDTILRLNRLVVDIQLTKDGYLIKSVESELDFGIRRYLSYILIAKL